MTRLREVLSTFDLTMIAVGGTIGSGIFLTPSLVAGQLVSPVMILGIWVLGGIVTLCGALSFAELAGMMPKAGGMYAYLSESFGDLAGFLFGWAYLLVVNTGGIAALSLAFATYLGYFIPLDQFSTQLTACLGLAAVTALNIGGTKVGGLFADFFTLLKLLGIAILIFFGLGWGSRELFAVSQEQPSLVLDFNGSFAVAMVGVLWSFGGWQHASFATAEAKDASRSVPRAMIGGAIIVTTVYLLANVAYLLLLSPSEMGASPRVASDAMERVLGPAGGSMIALFIFCSTLYAHSPADLLCHGKGWTLLSQGRRVTSAFQHSDVCHIAPIWLGSCPDPLLGDLQRADFLCRVHGLGVLRSDSRRCICAEKEKAPGRSSIPDTRISLHNCTLRWDCPLVCDQYPY